MQKIFFWGFGGSLLVGFAMGFLFWKIFFSQQQSSPNNDFTKNKNAADQNSQNTGKLSKRSELESQSISHNDSSDSESSASETKKKARTISDNNEAGNESKENETKAKYDLLLPDLTVEPLNEVFIIWEDRRKKLRFPSSFANKGRGPLEIEASDIASDNTVDVVQNLYKPKGQRPKVTKKHRSICF